MVLEYQMLIKDIYLIDFIELRQQELSHNKGSGLGLAIVKNSG